MMGGRKRSLTPAAQSIAMKLAGAGAANNSGIFGGATSELRSSYAGSSMRQAGGSTSGVAGGRITTPSPSPMIGRNHHKSKPSSSVEASSSSKSKKKSVTAGLLID